MSDGSSGARITNASVSTTPNRTDHTVTLESPTSSLDPTHSRASNDDDEVTWVHSFSRCDRILSGSSLHLCYRLLDIIILSIGLLSSKSQCPTSNRFETISICLLVFYFIDLTIIARYALRTMSRHYRSLTEDEKIEQHKRAAGLRGFFMLLKLIPVCIGVAYTFSSKATLTADCALIRFCLGIVCLSTLFIMIIPPAKPDVPARRSFVLECFILAFVLLVNGVYMGTVALAMKQVTNASCIYQETEDLYTKAPLKSYAQVGLLIFSYTAIVHILNLLVSQLSYRLTNGRRLYVFYYGLHYVLSYIGSILVVYYFSVGALFLFQPRSGQPCQASAPGLYRTLLIWQWIRILSPLLAAPLILALCCLGVVLGIVLSYCLPASITVPLLDALRVRERDGRRRCLSSS